MPGSELRHRPGSSGGAPHQDLQTRDRDVGKVFLLLSGIVTDQTLRHSSPAESGALSCHSGH